MRVLRVLTLLFWCAWSLGHLQGIPLSNEVRLYVHDIVLVFFIAIAGNMFRNELRARITKILQRRWRLAVWISLALGIGVYHSGVFVLLYAARLSAYVVFIMLQQHIWKAEGRKAVLIPLTAGIMSIIFGFLQYTLLPDLRFLKILGWDDHYYRMAGTMLDPNFFAVTVIWTLIAAHTTKYITKYMSFLHALTLASIGAILLSFSRASYLALAAVMLMAGIQKRSVIRQYVQQQKVMVVGFVALLIVLASITTNYGGEGVNLLRTSSITARITTTQSALAALNTPAKLVLGTGLFSTQSHQANTHLDLPYHANLADNIVVLCITSFGLLGVVLLLYNLGKIASWYLKLPATKKILLISLVIHSMFNNTVLEPFSFLYFWSLWTLL